MNNQPLVTIRILTYNSSEYVLDALNSALAQTYQNTEIIISDDCSTDNTVEVCRQWVEKHKNCGKRIVLLESDKNTGVSGNCNRTLKAARGKWLKGLAGDDMLAPTAIEDYIDYVTTHPNVRHMIAKSVHFTGQFRESDLQNPTEVSPYLYREEATAKFQYKVICRCFFGYGPTYFIHTDTLRSVGGYDERFPMQEDYPLFIKMIGVGHKMVFMDKVTVYYREGNDSVSHAKDMGAIFSKNRVRIVSEYKFKYREESLSGLWKWFHYYSLWLDSAIIKAGNTYHLPKCRFLFFIHKTTDPFLWYTRYIERQQKRYLKKCRFNEYA
jgi:alpha-1,3-rhamnosyltransferase